MRVFTKSFSTAFTITNDDNIYTMSIKASGGNVDVLGGASFQNNSSTALTLEDGQSLTLSAELSNPLEDITITPSVAVDVVLISNS